MTRPRSKAARKLPPGKSAEGSEISITATEFKARCLALMDDVGSGKVKRLIVSKHGKPIVQVDRIGKETAKPAPFIGFLKGVVTINPDFDAAGPSWDVEALGPFPSSDMEEDFAAIARRVRKSGP
ncbi:MAG TPA: hypothetical protein PLA85_01655 [Micropepsaceae bacterium]|nr:hypothetical protein [Micropepsaceae bacterium]